MGQAKQSDNRPRLRGGDRTLNQQIRRARRIEWFWLMVDLPALLFYESDMADLQRIALPSWWMAMMLILHGIVTCCISGYLSNTLRYLCFYRPSATIAKLKNSERQKRYQICCSSEGFCGGFAGVALVLLAVIPHILMSRRPDYHFFGFIIAKVAGFAVVIQAILLRKTIAEIRAGIREWQDLSLDFPGLSFADYAERYDGYEDSIWWD